MYKKEFVSKTEAYIWHLVNCNQVPENRVLQWCQQNGELPYFETSAKANVNILLVFQEIAKVAVEVSMKESLYALIVRLLLGSISI